MALRRSGFSLVEVTLAMGIVSFAFLTIVGLVSTGLKTFNRAVDASVGNQIFQRVINEAQQTDFDTLVDRHNVPNYPGDAPADFSFRAPTVNAGQTRYFDEQGTECQQTEAVYHVNTRIQPSTQLVATNGAASNGSVATVTVQIANNPGNVTPVLESNLWTECPGVAILTQSTLVARNK